MSYEALTSRLARGWNTWHVKSMLTHVLLPEAMALQLGIKEYRGGQHLREFIKGLIDIRPGVRTYDGSYTDLTLQWEGIVLRVQTGIEDGDLLVLASPQVMQRKPALLTVEGGMLWNRPGQWRLDGHRLCGEAGGQRLVVQATTEPVCEPHCWALTPYLALPLDGPVGLSTGRRRDLAEIQQALERLHAAEASRAAAYGDLAEVFRVSRAALAWNTIYDPLRNRVITPVTRAWCGQGWLLFEWDTYFAAYMFGLDGRDLALANAIAMTREITEEGLVPNSVNANGWVTRDRSEPPVGAWVCLALYRRWPERWFLEEVYGGLLRWNRWWWEARRERGLLCWGSTPYEPTVGNAWESKGVNGRFGASLESGLDNSPMYDDVPFDPVTHRMKLWDAGLNGLYAADCTALAEIAIVLGQDADATELRQRADAVRTALRERLWCEDRGLFLNRRTDTNEFSHRISPTNFYPLLADAAAPEQAKRMIAEHFRNPDEFWGEWMLPSIARNDPAFPEQSYWRGRVWGPMNFLVYLGLRRYDGLQEARRARLDLVEKSKALLLKNWVARGHVLENYNAETGDDAVAPGGMGGDSFYYWGGLLGTIALMESGFYSRSEVQA
jgi:hypothetical protein